MELLRNLLKVGNSVLVIAIHLLSRLEFFELQEIGLGRGEFTLDVIGSLHLNEPEGPATCRDADGKHKEYPSHGSSLREIVFPGYRTKLPPKC
jgi:hypothetical protein